MSFQIAGKEVWIMNTAEKTNGKGNGGQINVSKQPQREEQRGIISSLAVYESAKNVYSHITSFPVLYQVARKAEKWTEKSVRWSGLSAWLQEAGSNAEPGGLILIDRKLKEVLFAIDGKVNGYIDEPTKLRHDLNGSCQWIVGTSRGIFLSVPLVARVVPSSEGGGLDDGKKQISVIFKHVMELPGWACEQVMAYVPDHHKAKLQKVPLIGRALTNAEKTAPEDELPPLDTVVEPDQFAESPLPEGFSDPSLGNLPVITEEFLLSHNQSNPGLWRHLSHRTSISHRHRLGSGTSRSSRNNSFISAFSGFHSDGAESWNSDGFHTPNYSEHDEVDHDDFQISDEAVFFSIPVHLPQGDSQEDNFLEAHSSEEKMMPHDVGDSKAGTHPTLQS